MILSTQLTLVICVITISLVLGSNSLNTIVELQANPCKYCSEDCKIYSNETHLLLECKDSQLICGCAYPISDKDNPPPAPLRHHVYSEGTYPSPKRVLLFLLIPPVLFLGIISIFWCYRHGICCNKLMSDEIKPFPARVVVRHPAQTNSSPCDQVFTTQMSDWNCSHVDHTNSPTGHCRTCEHVPSAPEYWDPPPPYSSISQRV